MPIPKFEELAGAVDGANVAFSTPTSYIAGTLTLWIRGLPRPLGNDDGGFEVDPDAGTLTLKEAPLAGDSVAAFYLEPTPETADQVDELEGLVEGDDIAGEFSDTLELEGLVDGDDIAGEVREMVLLGGNIEPIPIDGTIEVCP